MNPTHRDIDPFQLELMKSCFDTIADDMALTLMRTAHSGIVRDSLDFSTALLDAEGLTVAQGICTPMHMGSFYDAMRKLIVQYDGRVDPGDVFIFNDPYAAEGQHLPDIYITTPIFTREGRGPQGRLVAWATTVAHHSDVGGIVAGSNALGAEEIFQEGLRLPIVKFIARGEPNQALWDVIALNVRTPGEGHGRSCRRSSPRAGAASAKCWSCSTGTASIHGARLRDAPPGLCGAAHPGGNRRVSGRGLRIHRSHRRSR